jgi:hypothetical protein
MRKAILRSALAAGAAAALIGAGTGVAKADPWVDYANGLSAQTCDYWGYYGELEGNWINYQCSYALGGYQLWVDRN